MLTELKYLSSYVKSFKLPISVQYIVNRKHPERFFHSHQFVEMVIVLKGTATHIIDKYKFDLKAGDVLIIEPQLSHAYDNIDNFEIVNILFDHEKLPMPLLDAVALPIFQRLFPESSNAFNAEICAAAVLHIKNKKYMKNILRLIENLNRQLNESHPGCMFNALAVFMDLCIKLANLDRQPATIKSGEFLLGNIIQYMNNHFKEPLTVKMLAKRANMSIRSFFRQFKLESGMTPINYLLCLKIQHAENLLLYSAKNIGEIALESGFSDSNYLSVCFKKCHGISPQKFRRNFINSNTDIS